MHHENHILRDLGAGRSTADSIAARLRMPADMVSAILARLVKEEKVTIPTRLAGTIPVYEIRIQS